LNFFARCYGWGTTSECRFKIGDFAPTVPVDPKFQVEGIAPTNHSSSQKTRLNGLSYGIKIWTDHSSVLSQCTYAFDRRADGRTELSSLYRVCIACSAIKSVNNCAQRVVICDIIETVGQSSMFCKSITLRAGPRLFAVIVGDRQIMRNERERQKMPLRSPHSIKPYSYNPVARSIPAPRYDPAPSFPSTPAHRSVQFSAHYAATLLIKFVDFSLNRLSRTVGYYDKTI